MEHSAENNNNGNNPVAFNTLVPHSLQELNPNLIISDIQFADNATTIIIKAELPPSQLTQQTQQLPPQSYQKTITATTTTVTTTTAKVTEKTNTGNNNNNQNNNNEESNSNGGTSIDSLSSELDHLQQQLEQQEQRQREREQQQQQQQIQTTQQKTSIENYTTPDKSKAQQQSQQVTTPNLSQLPPKNENEIFNLLGKSLTKNFTKTLHSSSPVDKLLNHHPVEQIPTRLSISTPITNNNSPQVTFSPDVKEISIPTEITYSEDTPNHNEFSRRDNFEGISVQQSASIGEDDGWQKGEDLTTNQLTAILSRMQVSRYFSAIHPGFCLYTILPRID